MKSHDLKQAPSAMQRQAAADAVSGSQASSADMAGGRWSDSPLQRLQKTQIAQLQAPDSHDPAAAGDGQGLPAPLRQGIEALSGMSMADVRVHRNSSKPGPLQAHAFAQGREIHLAPGQEQHLPHEAWHVVQQAQGRVQPSRTEPGAPPINDDRSLEQEADRMGARALQMKAAPSAGAAPLSAPRGRQAALQRKGRIDLNQVPFEKRDQVQQAIEALKTKKRQDKLSRSQEWLGKTDGKTDEAYNTDMANIRMAYEAGIQGLAKNLPKEAYVDKEAYYGSQVGSTPVFKRPDNGKEYVRDSRGTFVPRYIRRELNQRDPKSGDLKPTGISTYGGLESDKNMDITGLNASAGISWPHREFMQQSGGGGGNQFAFSHTSTKRPILSNDHESFGTYANGAILTDLSKVDHDKFLAQWGIDPTHGHKVPLKPGDHQALGFKAQPGKGGKRGRSAVAPDVRDQVVRRSGYRNMEVVTADVPETSIVKRWSGADGSRSDYALNGISPRGQEMVKERQRLEKAHGEKLREESQARRLQEDASKARSLNLWG